MAMIAATDDGSMISLNNFHRLRDEILSQLKLNFKNQDFFAEGEQLKSRVKCFSLAPLAIRTDAYPAVCGVMWSQVGLLDILGSVVLRAPRVSPKDGPG